MPPLQSYFDDFLAKIRLQSDLRDALQEAHQDLTRRLESDVLLKPIFVNTFLQGSYKRSTILDPDEEEPADVDVVVVTGIDERVHREPSTAMRLFEPFLESNYPNKWEPQDRSFGIVDGRVKMDMVITSAPSEAVREIIASRAIRSRLGLEDDPDYRVRRAWLEPQARATKGNWRAAMEEEAKETAAWREEPLRIPDRRQRCWEPTHPLAQIDWTAEKNAACGGKYLDVVRAIKWWRRRNPTPKYPKGYPVEHLVGDACPNGIVTTAEGVTRTLEALRDKWAGASASRQQPYLCDHGVQQNVLARVSAEDFADFHTLIGPAASIARQAIDTDDKHVGVQLWQKLFGARFPDPPEWGRGGRGPGDPEPPAGGFTPRKEQGLVGGGRYA
jgi:hypothetical protein